MNENKDILILNSTKEDGNTAEKYAPNRGKKNTLLFFNQHEIDVNRAILLNICDQNMIVEVQKENIQKDEYEIPYIKADALITREKELFLYQKFADCVPFIVYDSKQSILAVAHMGWVSTKGNLHLELIDTFLKHYGSNSTDLEVYMGPSIAKESYVMLHPVQLEMKGWEPYLINYGKDYYGVDLKGYIRSGLEKTGILKEHICESSVDTATDPAFFSHYNSMRDSSLEEGRFICGAMIKK